MAEMEEMQDQTTEPTEQAMPPQAAQAVEYGQQDNLAAVLPLPYLRKVGALVLQQAEMDYKSSEGWRRKTAKHLKLYNGDVEDLPSDQENITVMHMPYTKRAVRMFHSKMFPQLYPADGEIVNLRVRSPEIKQIAERCTFHMNHQLVNEIVEYIPSHDRGMKQELIEGTIYETFWWDPVQERPCQEICLAEDVWISYKHKTDRPDLADVPRITWRKRYHQHELEAMEDAGYYIGITKPVIRGDEAQEPLYKDDSYDEAGSPKDGGGQMAEQDEKPVKEEADSHVGHAPADDDPDAPREILEQDRMLRLPGEPRQRAVTVCVDRVTGNVLSLRFREMESARDRLRFKREEELINAQLESARAMLDEQHGAAMAAYEEAVRAGLVDPAVEPMPMRPADPQPPQPPRPIKRVPWNRWVKYDCDTNPEGALGHGIPHDVAGHNMLANKIATRAVSLLTMNLLPTGFASRQSRFARGEVQVKLGKIVETPMSPTEVERGAGMHLFQFPPPDSNWWKVLEFSDKSCQEVTAFDIAMGAPGMSGETATEAEMRHSNATDNISMIAARYNRGRAFSLRNLAYVNSLTLPPEGVKLYKDGMEMVVTREDYAAILEELEVTFTSDPQMESAAIRERRAMKMFQTALQIATTAVGPGGPPVLDPQTTVTLIRGVAVKVLEALQFPKELIQAVMDAPMPQQPMMTGEEGGPIDGEAEGAGPGLDGEGPGDLPPDEGGAEDEGALAGPPQ